MGLGCDRRILSYFGFLLLILIAPKIKGGQIPMSSGEMGFLLNFRCRNDGVLSLTMHYRV